MGILDKYEQRNETPKIKWIDISGYTKSGKTSTLVELAKHVKLLHVDCENGTKPYIGNFCHITANNLADLPRLLQEAKQHPDQFDHVICVIDPWTKLVSMIADGLLKSSGKDNLKDISQAGVGNGWTLLYQKVIRLMERIWEVFPLVITVSHLRLDNNFTDSKAVKIVDLDLMGKIKNFHLRECDCFFVFTSDTVDGKFVTRVNDDQNSDLIKVPLGMRGYDFVERIKTSEDLIEEIGSWFGKEIDKNNLFQEQKAKVIIKQLGV